MLPDYSTTVYQATSPLTLSLYSDRSTLVYVYIYIYIERERESSVWTLSV